MKAIDRPFTQIINGATQFLIPVFQRDYTWGAETQCAQLWWDVQSAARATGDHGHFLGSIVYVATDDTGAGLTRWMVIDGQQRLTTLTLLLAALRDHIRKSGWTGGEDDPTANRIEAYFLKNTQEDGDRQQKLVLRRHDQTTLRAVLDGVDLPQNASPAIVENYKYFRGQMADADPSEIYRGISRLLIVDVMLNAKTDNPQLIFESLNSTGVDLSQSDLIRNFILMRLPDREQTHLYETYWSKIEALFRGYPRTFDAFARDFVALQTKASKQERADRVYFAFRAFFSGFAESLGGTESALKEMLRYARYHAAFSLGRDVTGRRFQALHKLRGLVDVPALLVMRLFDRRDHLTTLTEADFLSALALIEGYVLRRAICGWQTRNYWQVFASIAYGVGETTPFDDLKVALARLREGARFPSNGEFERNLKERDVYGLQACRHLLEGLENERSKEPTDTTDYSIEHILPQNENLRPEWRSMLGDNCKEIQKTWLNRLGNLTLTGYNSTYSDRPFEEKKTIAGGFEESSVRLNRFVREQEQWTEREISERTDALARRAIEIWAAPSVTTAQIAAAEEQERRELAARRDVGKVPMSAEARSLFETLQPAVLALGGDVIECAETKSVSYWGPLFFMEVVPRLGGLTVLLNLDFDDIEDPSGLAKDGTLWTFVVNAQHHRGGVHVNLADAGAIERTLPLIRQAYEVSRQ